MKKLILIEKSTPVIGKVIEYADSLGFCLREYGENAFGTYDVLSTVPLEVDSMAILRLDGLAARVKRLHYYFKAAEYISESAIYVLNIYDEPVVETLTGIVRFGI